MLDLLTLDEHLTLRTDPSRNEFGTTQFPSRLVIRNSSCALLAPSVCIRGAEQPHAEPPSGLAAERGSRAIILLTLGYFGQHPSRCKMFQVHWD